MKEMNSKISNYPVKVCINKFEDNDDEKEFFSLKSKRDLSMQELKKIYWAEKELVIVIPMLIKSTINRELVENLKLHLNYTQERIKRLEKIFPLISEIIAN